MRTLLAIALAGGMLAGPALAADACLRPIDINSTNPVNDRTVNITTFGRSKPNFVMTFHNSCPGLAFGNPLVFTHIINRTDCVTVAEPVKVLDTTSHMSSPCMIKTITAVPKGTPMPSKGS